MTHPKLITLCDIEGYKPDEDGVLALLEAAVADSVVPGICTAEGCSYSTSVEPDQEHGWCEECESGTVASCLILAGII